MTPCAAAVLAVLVALPVQDEAWPERARPIALAVDDAAHTPRQGALLVTLGYFESGWIERIQLGRCERWECDPESRPDGQVFHRARGYWQLQASPLVPRAKWRLVAGPGYDPLVRGARAAAAVVERGERACRSAAGAASYYATGHCRWPGGARRGAFAERLEPRLAACDYR